jgi:hypothetical protein
LPWIVSGQPMSSRFHRRGRRSTAVPVVQLPLLQICAEETDGGVWAEVFGALPQIGHEDREPLMEAMPAIRAPFPARSAV